MEFGPVKRIGVFKLRNIGDVLITTPVFRALRQAFPQAHITAVVNSVTDAMLKNNPHLDRVIVYERPPAEAGLARKVASEINYWKAIRTARFDLAFDFTRGDRPAFSCWLSGAKIRVASYGGWSKSNWRNWAYTHVTPAPALVHEVEQHLRVLNDIGIPTPDERLCLVVPEEEHAWARALIAPYRPAKKIVHVHPVARWLFKCWDDEKMAAVIDWLQAEQNAQVFVTSSAAPRELQRTRNILAYCRTKPVLLAGNISLTQLAALAEQADLFFGVDTAPMHVAAAVETPVVALFGPTNANAWHPWSRQQITLRRDCPCEATGTKACDWSKVRACMSAISVRDAREAIGKYLK